MDEIEERIAGAERDLRRARHILAVGGRCDSYDWSLLAILVGEADLVLRDARQHFPRLDVPLMAEVVEELRDATANFTDPHFLRSTRAARRRNPALFVPGLTP